MICDVVSLYFFNHPALYAGQRCVLFNGRFFHLDSNHDTIAVFVVVQTPLCGVIGTCYYSFSAVKLSHL